MAHNVTGITIAVRRAGGSEQVEMPVPSTVADCRAGVAVSWGWQVGRIQLQRSSGEPLQDDTLEIIDGAVLIASRSPWPVGVEVRPPGVALEGPPEQDLHIEMPVGQTSAVELKRILQKRLGLHWRIFMLHPHPADEQRRNDNMGLTPKAAAGAMSLPAEDAAQEPEEEAECILEGVEGALPNPLAATDAQVTMEERAPEVEHAAAKVHIIQTCLESAGRALKACREAEKAASQEVPKATAALKFAKKQASLERAQETEEAAEDVRAAAAQASQAAKQCDANRDTINVELAAALEAEKAAIETKLATGQVAADADAAQKQAAEELAIAKKRRKRIGPCMEVLQEADAVLAKASGIAAQVAELADKGAGLKAVLAEHAKTAEGCAARSDHAADTAKGLAEEATVVSDMAHEADRRAQAEWREESLEGEMQDLGPPAPALAFRDDSDLEVLNVTRVLCRIRPRAVRLVSELRHRDEHWAAMGGTRGQPVVPKMDIADIRHILSSSWSTSNGDLEFSPLEDPWNWKVRLRGPRGSCYKGGLFTTELTLIPTWPGLPPEVRFCTPVYHCNVGENGEISPEALATVCSDYTRQWSIFSYLGAVSSLLCVPTPEAPARADVADLLRRDKVANDQAAAEHVRSHATPVR